MTWVKASRTGHGHDGERAQIDLRHSIVPADSRDCRRCLCLNYFRPIMWIAGIVILLVAAGLAMSTLAGRYLFDRRVADEATALFKGVPPAGAPIDVAAATADLPFLVRRYLRQALGASTVPVESARLLHGGRFRLRADATWLDVEGEEYFRTDPPQYLWHAVVRMAPLLWFEVRDFYREGDAQVLAKLDSVVPVAESAGPEVAISALIRWAGETVLFPQALANSKRFSWQADGPDSALLSVRDAGLLARLRFHFAADGFPDRITSDDRYMSLEGRQVKRPFVVYCRSWRSMAGAMVPAEIEAAWQLEGGEFSYARFTVHRIEVNVAGRYSRMGAAAVNPR